MFPDLSERQLECLKMIASGDTNHEIARALSLELSSVTPIICGLYDHAGIDGRKYGVARVRLALWYWKRLAGIDG